RCGRRGRTASVLGRNPDLHLPRLPDPQRGCAADQLPPARVDAADAGVGVRGQGAVAGGLRARGRAALPLLLLWRRTAAFSRRSALMITISTPAPATFQPGKPERHPNSWSCPCT